MTAATPLRTVAAISAWLALGLGAATSALAPWVAVAAAALTVLLWTPWTRVAHWVPLVVGLTCVAQVLSGVSVVSASAMGVLVLLHVLLADLAADATGASARAVGRALRELAPGVAAGAVAAIALPLGLTATTAMPEHWNAALRLAAPLLLLSVALLALGMTSRRAAWTYVVRRGALSAVTRRYLRRAREER